MPTTKSDAKTKVDYKQYYEKLRPFLEKRRNQSYTATILSFLAIALFGLYAVRPTIQTIIYLRREIADKTIVNRKMEEKIAALIEAQANYQAAADQLPLVAKALPDNPEATELLVQIKKLADSTHASLSAVRIPSVPLAAGQRPQTKDPPKKRQVNFDTAVLTSGNWTEIKSFLDGIIELRRILIIDSLTINPVKEEEQFTNIATQSPLRLTINILAGYLSSDPKKAETKNEP